MERPGKVVSPQTLYQGLLQELQLVGHATRPAQISDWRLRRHRRRLGHRVRQGRALKVLVQQGGLADAFAWAGVLVHAAAGQPDQGAGGVGTDRWMKRDIYLMEFLTESTKRPTETETVQLELWPPLLMQPLIYWSVTHFLRACARGKICTSKFIHATYDQWRYSSANKSSVLYR